MRPIWNGMISFGLVNIPIGLYPATDENDIHFNLLHKEDGGRIKNQRVCSIDGKTVEYDDIVKGYEYEKGQYVTLTDEDLEKVKASGSDRVIIEDFVDAGEIDAKFFEKPYVIVPGKKSDAAYVLLREALKSTGKVGIARIVLRTRERLAAVRVDGAALMLDTMHFADELRPVEGLPAESIAVGKREMEMAKMLIDAMSTKFDPAKYRDEYRAAVLEMINDKVEGKEVISESPRTEPTEVIDLMKYLKASIEKTGRTKVPETVEATEQPSTPSAKQPTKTKRRTAAGG